MLETELWNSLHLGFGDAQTVPGYSWLAHSLLHAQLVTPCNSQTCLYITLTIVISQMRSFEHGPQVSEFLEIPQVLTRCRTFEGGVL